MKNERQQTDTKINSQKKIQTTLQKILNLKNKNNLKSTAADTQLNPEEFKVIKVLGKGSFGNVYAVEHNN